MHSCSERKMMIWSLCLIFSLSYSILVFASPANHLCLPDQKDALWEFKSEFHFTGMAGDDKTQRWRNNTDCCSWGGISCDLKTGKVVELNLWESSLNGSLRSNSGLFRLQHLQSLNLSSNNLAGILPDSIGSLKYLRVLKLSLCNLFGKITSSLGNLSYLTHLDFDGNGFTGELPDSISNLNQLTELLLASSKLSGNFPDRLFNLSELTAIKLYSNQLEGTLPSNMSSLSKLEYFVIGSNSFSGSIPSSLFMIPSLVYLSLEKNDFNGPLEIGNISSPSKFQYLSLGGNHLNISEFPKFLQMQTSLFYLDISASQIQGQVPEWLWRLPELCFVDFSRNSFSGFDGPADVFQRNTIYMLDISSNTFQDPFPLLPKSMELFLASDNRFSGEIPTTICELVSLHILVLSNNNFSGSIPRCSEDFNAYISILHLQNNSLFGGFPEEFIGDKLISLDVGHNQLSGELPKSLINCTNLEFLNVEDNLFNDTFPFWLRLLPNLQILVFFFFFFFGKRFFILKLSSITGVNVPQQDDKINNKYNKQILVLRSNNFHGPISPPRVSLSFPKLRIFDISENSFTGVLPSDYFSGWTALSSSVVVEDLTRSRYLTLSRYLVRFMEKYTKSVNLTIKGLKMELVGILFTMYKTIDVSGNKLEGDIPESIRLLKELIVLNMSNNAFTGHIPPSLENLTNLQSLDLSQNRLFGEIPPELGKLTLSEDEFLLQHA